MFVQHRYELLKVQFVCLELLVFLLEEIGVKILLGLAVFSASYHVQRNPTVRLCSK